MSSLFDAIEKGQPDIALQLIEQGVDVNQGLDGGNMPIHIASFNGYTKVVKQLISNGAKVNAKITGGGDPGATPLHLAAMKGQADVISILLENGADVSSRLEGGGQTSTSGATPLHLAATHNQIQIVKILVQSGANLTCMATPSCAPIPEYL